MQLEKNGSYEIIDIKFKKNCIILIINEQEYKISITTYSHFYLYKGRKLSQEEFDDIFSFEKKSKIKDYLFKLVTSGTYSEKQVREKLQKKRISKDDIEELVEEFKNNGYINDRNFIEEKIEILEKKKFGKNKIISSLLTNGISKNDINNISFENEIEKANSLLEKFIIHHKDYSLVQLKQGGYRYLLSNGFDSEISISICEKRFANFEVNEIGQIEKIISKYVLLHHFDLDSGSDKEKVISYLRRKGYRYDDINEIIRRFKK